MFGAECILSSFINDFRSEQSEKNLIIKPQKKH